MPKQSNKQPIYPTKLKYRTCKLAVCKITAKVCQCFYRKGKVQADRGITCHRK